MVGAVKIVSNIFEMRIDHTETECVPMADDTGKDQKEGIAGRIKRLFGPDNSGCGCSGGCCGDIKIVPKKTGEKKE
jgi:hypothetical protein